MASDKVLILTKDNFEEEAIKSDIPVVVDFWASWCGPCRMVAPVMDQLAEEFDGTVKICKVNVDEEASLATKFRVMSIPTIILMKNGESVERVVGARSKDEFTGLIKNKLL